MVRAAVLALSAKFYGGDSYFRGIIPALDRYGDGAEFVILARDNRYIPLASGGRVRVVQVAAPAHWALRFLWEQVVLPPLLRRLNVDVVYTANNVGLLFSPVPCVVAVRNMEPLAGRKGGVPLGLRAKLSLLRLLTVISARRAARIVAVSQFVARVLQDLSIQQSKIDIIYHGIDDLRESEVGPAIRDIPADFVLAAGKFVRYANLTTIVRAFHHMRRWGYSGNLVFVGGGYDQPYERDVRSLVARLDLDAHVRFFGYVSRATLQTLMRNSRIFFFSSTLEACPFTLLEAMYHGAVIVSTDGEPMREFAADAAVYVQPYDAEGFARAALSLFSDEAARARLSRRARRRAEGFTWERSVRSLVRTLTEAAKVARDPAPLGPRL